MTGESGAPRSVGALVEQSCASFGEHVAFRTRDGAAGEWRDTDWFDLGERVRQHAAALLALGVEKGDRVAILSASRLEWVIADLGNFTAGAVSVPIYPSLLTEEVEYLLTHSEARVVLVEDREQLVKVLEAKPRLPKLEKVVICDRAPREDSGLLVGFETFLEQGEKALAERPSLVHDRQAAVTPEDVATLCYTSGTTGRPKGAVLTHGNLLFEIAAVSKALASGRQDETLLFLPLAHIFARIGYLAGLDTGYTTSFAESMDTLLRDLGEVKPTFLFSVPRIYEKIHGKILSGVEGGSRLKKQIFGFALAVGRRTSAIEQAGKRVPPWWLLARDMADMLVFRKVRAAFGGEIRFCVSGGAPLAKELQEFFHAAGVLILEGYGLTENVGGFTLNRPDDYRFGTVGKPVDGVELRIAEDGEILLKGGNVLREYFMRPEATAEALVDGWFHTGDIGDVDADGFLRITDRKKDLIVTSGGKNIAPQNLENRIKADAAISQVMVHGDRRNYLTALITLDEEEITRWATEQGIAFEQFAELATHERVRERIEAAVAEKNRALASYETIKRFSIVYPDFEIGDELTPTLKVKRKHTTEKYAALLESLYGA